MTHAAAMDFTGAVADGELELVPPAIRAHIDGCPVCSLEVRWQREVQTGLAAALAAEAAGAATRAPAHRRGVRPGFRLPGPALIAGIAAAALVLATAGVLSLGRQGAPQPAAPGADTVLAAAQRAYGSPPAMETSDPAAVAGWTAAHGMGAMTPPAVEGATLMGVRAGTMAGASRVTFVYAGPAGRVEVTPLAVPATADWPMSETRMMGGLAVGMMGHAGSRMAIVAPDEAELTTVMTSIQ